MTKLFIFLLSTVYCISTAAQSTAGVTGKRDTSYSSYSAYASTKKSYPDIALVPEFHKAAVREVKDISYCTTGSRSLVLDAFYSKKKSKVKRPAVLLIHGGGWRSGNRTQHYPLAQKLAALGYACFTPEYRLSTEALYPAGVYDLKAALRWLRANASRYNVDTAKIAVLGFSAGGELAAFVGTTANDPKYEGDSCHRPYSSSVQAIIDLDGTLSFVHPESREGGDSNKPSASALWFGYAKNDNIALWEDASPLAHVGKATPPTLFINSSLPWMHAGREDFRNVLNQYGIYSEVHSFENSPHSFPLFTPWFEPMVQYIDNFLKTVFHQ